MLKGIPLFSFSCVPNPSRALHNTQPLQAAFPLLERVVLKSPKEVVLGEDSCLWQGGVDKEERREGSASPLWMLKSSRSVCFWVHAEGVM